MTHFDTNFLIQATKAGSPAHTKFQQWTASNDSFGISAIAWAEYLCGPLDPAGETLARSMFLVHRSGPIPATSKAGCQPALRWQGQVAPVADSAGGFCFQTN